MPEDLSATPCADATPGPGPYDHVADALRAMRAEAGQVSYADIVLRIARRRRESGDGTRPARTTVYDAFRHGRSRVNPRLVGEIVLALTDDADRAAEWERRCVEARAANELAGRPLPQPDAEQDAEPVVEPVVEPAPARIPEPARGPIPGSLHESVTEPVPTSGDEAGVQPAAEPDPTSTASVGDLPTPGTDHRAVSHPVVRRPLPAGPAVVVAALAVLVNLAGTFLSTALQLPVFLDMIGTALAAFVLGPLGGAAVGVASNAAGVVVNGPENLMFALVQVAGALVWGVGLRRGLGLGVSRLVVLACCAALACSLMATPLLGVDEVHSVARPLYDRVVALVTGGPPGFFLANLFYSVLDKLVATFVAAGVVTAVPALHVACAGLLVAHHAGAHGDVGVERDPR